MFLIRKAAKGILLIEYRPHYIDGADDLIIKYVYNEKYDEILICLQSKPIVTATVRNIFTASQLLGLKERLLAARNVALTINHRG